MIYMLSDSYILESMSFHFIDNFTSGMKTQSIAYLLRESEHIYWILGHQGEVHSIWDLCTSGFQECKGDLPWNWGGGVANSYWLGSPPKIKLGGVAQGSWIMAQPWPPLPLWWVMAWPVGARLITSFMVFNITHYFEVTHYYSIILLM